jgi:peptide-methionine (R)-S-oxide reductase
MISRHGTLAGVMLLLALFVGWSVLPSDAGAPRSDPSVAMKKKQPPAPSSRKENRVTEPTPPTDAASTEAVKKADWKKVSEAEWRKRLTPEQYHVTRQKGTERPFTGKYWKTKTEGTYRCVGCGLELFSSEAKFDAHCGWPSFYKPVDKDAVETAPDFSHFMRRTEVLCPRCGAHLGHVFPDGPKPTGLRYCINSASLKLDEAKPAKEPDGAGKAEK